MKKTGTDHVKTLANALKYLENTSGIEEETQIVTEPDEENICVTIYNLARELNESIKSTGKKIKDIFPDYEKVSEFNLTNLLFTIDPKLFAFVFLVTMSAKECKLLDEAEIDWNSPGWLLNLVDFDNNNSYTRLIRRVFICYALVFTRNPADKSPLHIAISDNIEKYSGSSELIRNLNKLGICLNGESFSEFKKNVVADLRQTGSLGVPNTLDPRLFFAVSADNTDINFVHSTIRDENGLARSYHALGSMLSIPSPNLFQARAQESADDNEPCYNFTIRKTDKVFNKRKTQNKRKYYLTQKHKFLFLKNVLLNYNNYFFSYTHNFQRLLFVSSSCNHFINFISAPSLQHFSSSNGICVSISSISKTSSSSCHGIADLPEYSYPKTFPTNLFNSLFNLSGLPCYNFTLRKMDKVFNKRKTQNKRKYYLTQKHKFLFLRNGHKSGHK